MATANSHSATSESVRPTKRDVDSAAHHGQRERAVWPISPVTTPHALNFSARLRVNSSINAQTSHAVNCSSVELYRHKQKDRLGRSGHPLRFVGLVVSLVYFYRGGRKRFGSPVGLTIQLFQQTSYRSFRLSCLIFSSSRRRFTRARRTRRRRIGRRYVGVRLNELLDETHHHTATG